MIKRTLLAASLWLLLLPGVALAQTPIACANPGAAYVQPFHIIQESGTLTAWNSHCREFPIDGVDNTADPANLALFVGSVGDRWSMTWANRCTNCAPGEHDNLPWVTVNGAVKGYKFSDYRTADACTVAQLFVLFGDLDAARNSLPGSPGGVSAIMPGELASAYIDINGNLMDVCDLRIGALPQDVTITGVMLDYEVCDGRSPNQALILAGAYGAVARSYGTKAMFYTNRLTAPCGGPMNGITANNGNTLLRTYGFGTIMTDTTIGDNARLIDLTTQLAMVATSAEDRARIIVQVQIGSGMTCAALKTVHDFILTNRLYGAEAWPDYADVSNPASVYFARIRYLAYPDTNPCL